MGNHRTGLKSGPWSSLVIAGNPGRTLQSDFLRQPEPIQVLITYQHHLQMYFSGPCYYRQTMGNIIQIRYVKPPKCSKLGRGICMCKVCTSMLPVLLLGHTLNDHNSFSGSICLLQPCFLSTNFQLPFTTFYPVDCFYSVFLILQTVVISELLTFLLLKKGFFGDKGLKPDLKLCLKNL